MNAVTTPEQQGLARQLREQLASYEESRDLIEVGAYVAGSNPQTDLAIARREHVLSFLQQGSHDPVPFDRVWSELRDALGNVTQDPFS